MNGAQIIEYATRERFRVVVTEVMVVEAVARLASPFTCRDVVEAIARDDRGCAVSEYLGALWIEDLKICMRNYAEGARCARKKNHPGACSQLPDGPR